MNDNDGTSNIGETCKAENPKLDHPHVEDPDSSQPAPNENLSSMKELKYSRQEVQAKPEKYYFSKCLNTYISESGLGQHLKSKHSPTLHCDQSTQSFAYHSQLKVNKEKHTK